MTSSAPQPAARDDGPYRDRELAVSFGADPARYDRSRPSYPQALADDVLAGLPGRDVLDVGIGTGLSSRPFRAAGAEVLGVDADPRMAGFARSRGYQVQVARFEQWDPAGQLFHAVIAGQAWHWIDPVDGAVCAARALRPGGRLALFWNFAAPGPQVAAAFADTYRAVDTGLPSIPWTAPALAGYHRLFTAATAGIHAAGAFTEPAEARYTWQDTITRDRWLDQVPLARGHNRIPPGRLTELLSRLGQTVDQHGGSFTMNYTTIAITADPKPR